MTGSFSNTFRVGRKFWCTVSFPAEGDADGIGTLAMSWSPHPPRRLTRAERREWQQGIKALTDEIARHEGVPFVVIEV